MGLFPAYKEIAIQAEAVMVAMEEMGHKGMEKEEAVVEGQAEVERMDKTVKLNEDCK